MENIIIPAVKDTPYFPEVNFDYEKGICEISGESYMEDCYIFYFPLIEWINKYCSENKNLVFNIKLTYFNTQSSRMILKILETLGEFKMRGGKPTVNWYYLKNDPDMIGEVEDFEKDTGIEINLVEVDNK